MHVPQSMCLICVHANMHVTFVTPRIWRMHLYEFSCFFCWVLFIVCFIVSSKLLEQKATELKSLAILKETLSVTRKH